MLLYIKGVRNSAHTLAYSIVGLQEANLAYHFPVIYWNCANLISDSGGENSTVNYGKIASAIGRMRKEGINIVPPYINEARFGFKPEAGANRIGYGLKAVSGIGADIANAIVANQPYASAQDFYQKMQNYKNSSEEAKFGDKAMIQLIKAGCFDTLENISREEIMKNFIAYISNPITKLNIGNIEDLNNLGLLTEEQKKQELRYYRYRNYVFKKENLVKQTGKSVSTGFYKLDRKFAEPYFIENFVTFMTEGKDYEYTEDGYISVKKGSFDRVFDNLTADFKNKVLTNKDFLDKINKKKFDEVWTEKADGNISKWEMDSLYYYYTSHELQNVDRRKYNIVNFDDLKEEPEVSSVYSYRGKEKPRFKLVRICGTVIDKDKNHNTVTLLTPDGVVTVRFYKGQFGFYDREISEANDDGTKTKIEKSWFKRGTKLLVTGVRMEDQFIPRKYSDSIYKHTVQLIKDIDEKGALLLQSERYGTEKEGISV